MRETIRRALTSPWVNLFLIFLLMATLIVSVVALKTQQELRAEAALAQASASGILQKARSPGCWAYELREGEGNKVVDCLFGPGLDLESYLDKEVTVEGMKFQFDFGIYFIARKINLITPRPTSSQPVFSPDQPGPYLVGIFDDVFTDKKGDKVELRVYYPALSSGDSQPPDKSGSPYPFIVFAHGLAANKDMNTWVGRHLASWGYVAVLFSVPSPFIPEVKKWSGGIEETIDYLSAQKTEASLLFGMIDNGKIGVTGHSTGAGGALVAAAEDDRIKAIVPLAPCYHGGNKIIEATFKAIIDAAKKVKIPVQIQVGSLDGFCPPEGARVYYEALSTTKEIVEINGGNHVGYIDEGIEYEVAKLVDKKATISRQEQVRIAKKYLTAWFNYFLKQDTSFEKYIFGEEAKKDLDNGVLSYFVFQR